MDWTECELFLQLNTTIQKNNKLEIITNNSIEASSGSWWMQRMKNNYHFNSPKHHQHIEVTWRELQLLDGQLSHEIHQLATNIGLMNSTYGCS